jgi:predicted enzyme related to lactoylglutathione lyase
LNRFYANDADSAIAFYENLFDEKCSRRFTYKEINLEIARVGAVLIIAGSNEALQPFRTTQATFLVDSIHAYRDFLLKNGASIIRDLQNVPTGINMTVQHFDGTIVEYVEHKK